VATSTYNFDHSWRAILSTTETQFPYCHLTDGTFTDHMATARGIVGGSLGSLGRPNGDIFAFELAQNIRQVAWTAGSTIQKPGRLQSDLEASPILYGRWQRDDDQARQVPDATRSAR